MDLDDIQLAPPSVDTSTAEYADSVLNTLLELQLRLASSAAIFGEIINELIDDDDGFPLYSAGHPHKFRIADFAALTLQMERLSAKVEDIYAEWDELLRERGGDTHK